MTSEQNLRKISQQLWKSWTNWHYDRLQSAGYRLWREWNSEDTERFWLSEANIKKVAGSDGLNLELMKHAIELLEPSNVRWIKSLMERVMDHYLKKSKIATKIVIIIIIITYLLI
jgi:hypothetical protein